MSTPTLRAAAQALLPCPFCGGAPLLEDCRTIWVVRCSCEACVLGERAQEPDGSEPAGHWESIRQTAVDAWNRRAALSGPQPAADERVAELMRHVEDVERFARMLARNSGGRTSREIRRAESRLVDARRAVESSARALLAAGREDAEHAAMYRWLRDNCTLSDRDGWLMIQFEMSRLAADHPKEGRSEWVDADIRAAIQKGTP